MRPARGRLSGQALERYNGHPEPTGKHTENTSETKIRKTHNRKPLKQKQKAKVCWLFLGVFNSHAAKPRITPAVHFIRLNE